jgi:RNA polymerase sigma-70 factor (ECF subfamily)
MIVAKKIIEQCKQNISEAQKYIFETFSPIMLGLCMRYVRERDVAEDVMQEGFITIFSKIEQYRGSGSFEGWMKRIMINSALLYIRNKNREPSKFSFDTFYDIASETDEESNREEISENDEINSETEFSQEEIFEAIAKLPTGFRTIFNLYALDGFKHREIAEILKINIGTSKSQLVRARKKIQKNLTEIAINKMKNLK